MTRQQAEVPTASVNQSESAASARESTSSLRRHVTHHPFLLAQLLLICLGMRALTDSQIFARFARLLLRHVMPRGSSTVVLVSLVSKTLNRMYTMHFTLRLELAIVIVHAEETLCFTAQLLWFMKQSHVVFSDYSAMNLKTAEHQKMQRPEPKTLDMWKKPSILLQLPVARQNNAYCSTGCLTKHHHREG
ncbi:hypothetical protein Scep_000334 [Stephania cephalantha]|uniref:Uncharacterized protein n=1 Tax=Stephania cephalantha TaxID=152367 RepID=A0AAP0Q2W3_9MAGN